METAVRYLAGLVVTKLFTVLFVQGKVYFKTALSELLLYQVDIVIA